ncbi:MAG: FAD-binding oxidoreductase [Candidatus Helarchaeota archaeon]|nr:FAD-binding oxidoreductase [Candidatus Helarchaeota archaeon]
MITEKIMNEMIDIVGEDFVSSDPEDLYIYSYDMTEEHPGNPNAIAMPKTPEEIQKLLKVANEYKIPVIPYISGANIGGLTITHRGGMVMDFKRMREIVKFDEISKYVVVEPGVTFGHLKKYLNENHPDFIYSYAFAPPYTSITANALLEGLTEYSFRWGCMGDWITGLEVVLPTGEITKIGSCATSDNWNMKYPLPDMTGLFIGWQGMTGIVTKCAVKVVSKPPIRELYGAVYFGLNAMEEYYKRLSKTDLIHGDFSFNMETALMMGGKKHPLREIPADRPKMLSGLYVFANNKKELRIKGNTLSKIAAEVSEKTKEEIQVMPASGFMTGRMGKIIDLPTNLPEFFEFRSGEDKRGVGMSWLGTYCNPNNWKEYYEAGYKIMKDHGFSPTIFVKSMDSGHFYVVRFLIPFNRAVPGEAEEVRKILDELVDMGLPKGAIPYKCPTWAAKKVLKVIDPNWLALARKIRNTLDPNGIMNPDRWALLD